MTRLGARAWFGGLVCALGGLICLAAFAPWVSVTILGARGHIDGSDARLDGGTLAVLGGMTVALGLLLVGLTRSRSAPGRVSALRVGAIFAAALVGVVGVLVLRHQDHVLRSNTLWSTFSPLGGYFNVHAGPSWGFWLDLVGCTVLVVVAVAAGVVGLVDRAASTRGDQEALQDAQRAAVDRDDTAGEVRSGR